MLSIIYNAIERTASVITEKGEENFFTDVTLSYASMWVEIFEGTSLEPVFTAQNMRYKPAVFNGLYIYLKG